MGIKMKRVAKGVDFDEVEERDGVKSISRHITFDEDTEDPEKISTCADMLADGVHNNLMKNHYLFERLHLWFA